MSHVRDAHLASDRLPGNRPIGTAARVEALDRALDNGWTGLTPAEADMVIDYAATRYERGEIQGARDTLRHVLGCDLTAVYMLEAIMHTNTD